MPPEPPERIIDTARDVTTRAAIPAPAPEPGRFVNGIPVSRFYDEPPADLDPVKYMAARRDADQTGTRRRKQKQARGETRWQSQETPE